MLRPDNFKHSKYRNIIGPVDGIKPVFRSSQSGGTIGFDRPRRPISRLGQPVNSAISDFKRPEGYNPIMQPVIATSGSSGEGVIDWTEPNKKRGGFGFKRRSKKQGRSKGVRNNKSKKGWRKIVLRISLLLLIIILVVGGFLGWKFVKNTSKVFHGGIFGILDKTKLNGEDRGRVNILLAGNSSDDPGHSGADLTDSIMVISIDTINNSGYIMSIPRDLWVDYGVDGCSVGYKGKINAAFVCGEQIKFNEPNYAKGGIGLLQKIIQTNFGIDFNYYAVINFSAFRDTVNAVGGIDLNIATNDKRGLYDGNISKEYGGPLKLANGIQHLDGQTALNLARARCDTVCYGFTRGDFDRTEHQRQMLFALKDKAQSVGVLSNPAKISSLLDAVGNNVNTDIKTNEIRRMYDISKLISNNSVKSIGLADDDVKLVITGMINNQSTVRPTAGVDDFSQIKAFIKRISSNDPVAKEGATFVALNGSDTSGLAKENADVLTEKGLIMKAIANTTTRQNTTIVILNPKMTATNTYLSQKFGVTSTTDVVANPEAKNYDADFVIILGTDAVKSSSQ